MQVLKRVNYCVLGDVYTKGDFWRVSECLSGCVKVFQGECKFFGGYSY